MIVPMLVASLADGAKLLRVTVLSSLRRANAADWQLKCLVIWPCAMSGRLDWQAWRLAGQKNLSLILSPRPSGVGGGGPRWRGFQRCWHAEATAEGVLRFLEQVREGDLAHSKTSYLFGIHIGTNPPVPR